MLSLASEFVFAFRWTNRHSTAPLLFVLGKIITRFLVAIPLVIGASFITFSVLYFVPGDPVITMLGDRAGDRALVEKLRRELELDKPFLVRYGKFLGGLTRFDFGRSYRTNRPVAEELREALPATIELSVSGLAFALILGVFSGVLSGTRPYGKLDTIFMLLALLGVSIPVFWLGLILNYLFAFKYQIFAISGRIGENFFGYQPVTGFMILDAIWYRDLPLFSSAIQHLALPAITLGLIYSALIARMTRSSILEISNLDFMRTARAKGLPPAQVLRHLLRNAMIPVITVVGMQFGALLGGAIITEEIFGWRGVGTYLIQAILNRDIVAVQGAVMLVVFLFIAVNLVVDLLYLVIDPRMRDSV